MDQPLIELTPIQQEAVDRCTNVELRVVAVTGEAGTGKTTIIKKAVQALRNRGRSVALAAPTGRAARRIYEATGIPATTIHKLLAYGKPEIDEKTGQAKSDSAPYYTKDCPISQVDVFVDEYAMVNEELHRNLLDALPPGGRLLAFGDNNQLPPIENHEMMTAKALEGSPFQRLLKMKNAITLEQVFRQGEDSGILLNARLIKLGKPPVKKRDFTINITESPLLGLRNHIKTREIDYGALENQVISPARKGALGVHALNNVMQGFYNPHPEDFLELPRQKWDEKSPVRVSVGEKVIVNENTYDMRDFFERFSRWKDENTPIWDSFIPVPDRFTMLNGEIGIVSYVGADGSLAIDFGDREVEVPHSYRDYIARFNRMVTRDPRKVLDLAYAVTTHKMQGSECRNVCYILHQSLFYNVNRNNIYTAITRARDTVHLITDDKMWKKGASLTAQEKAAIMRERQKNK